jgi:hypothetical protein
LDSEEDDNESDLLPGTVREEYPGRRPVRPVTIPKNSNAPQQPATSTTTTTASAKATTSTKQLETSTKNVQEEIDAAHPEDNEVGGTNNNR